LLLDEIAELPIELQPKLLRVLEERSVIPVGGRDPIAVDIRLVSATHRSLRRAVDAGQFRADLMYRLRVIPLFIPPLRQRKNDIPLIADKLIARHNQRGKRRVSGLSQSALSLLEAYPWPGNVRELANALEYAYAIGDGPLITDADLPAELRGVEPVIEESPPRVHVPVQEEPRPEAHSAEARRILRAMERAGGHKRRAAESLGMSRTTLWRKLRELGLA
jgi:transcriptional regulator with PAS, ATPase and Fis domain